MQRVFGSRSLLAIAAALVLLLATLAAVQYRWSARVAAADAQREQEHLDSAATLFASEFNDLAVKTVQFMQNDAWSAWKAGEPLRTTPPIVQELYYLDLPDDGPARVQRLGSDGLFAPSALPDWLPAPHCIAMAIARPAALISPVYEMESIERTGSKSIRILQSLGKRPGKCFVARLNEAYLRSEYFPRLIRESFGETAAREYDFAVVPRAPASQPIYGNPLKADLRKPFYSISPIHLRRPNAVPGASRSAPQSRIFFQRFDSTIVINGDASIANLFGDGIWELQVAHKGVPLAAAFERTRRRNFLLSLAVEALLIAAIVFLLVATRRMQRLAEQKMQFIATVSHELRTPVSAIAMLSRNQADGLVNGADKVKQYGELIHRESRRLNDMVEQTLEYAGIHSGLRRPAAQSVDVRALVEEAVEARRAELARRGFDVDVSFGPDLPPISGDPKLLRIAFDNLLTNAEKHADGGRWIRVTATYWAATKEVRISVEDRGPGIDPADQAEIFEPFCRGPAAIEAQIPGSGLGLSLVRSAAQAHRGTVTLVSQPGRGSTFTMHLPV